MKLSSFLLVDLFVLAPFSINLLSLEEQSGTDHDIDVADRPLLAGICHSPVAATGRLRPLATGSTWHISALRICAPFGQARCDCWSDVMQSVVKLDAI